MAHKDCRDAWKEIEARGGFLSYTYEWDDSQDGWVVRERTAEEKAESQRVRTELQRVHDDSLSSRSQKFYQ